MLSGHIRPNANQYSEDGVDYTALWPSGIEGAAGRSKEHRGKLVLVVPVFRLGFLGRVRRLWVRQGYVGDTEMKMEYIIVCVREREFTPPPVHSSTTHSLASFSPPISST